MGCCFELSLLAWGGYLLGVGEFKMPGGRPIRGPLVRVAGFIFCLPLPLSFLIGFGIGFSTGLKGQRSIPKDSLAMMGLMELAIIAACFIIGGLMLWFASLNQSAPRRRRNEYGDPLDHYDDPRYGRRGRSIDFDEVFDTAPAVPRPRAPRVGTAENAEAIVTERPPIPPPLMPDASFIDEYPPERRQGDRRKGERRHSNDKKQTVVVLVMAVVLFLAVAGVGTMLMWPK